jgi:hypothetical protein
MIFLRFPKFNYQNRRVGEFHLEGLSFNRMPSNRTVVRRFIERRYIERTFIERRYIENRYIEKNIFRIYLYIERRYIEQDLEYRNIEKFMFSIHEIQFCIFTVVKNVEVLTNALVKQEKKTTNISG